MHLLATEQIPVKKAVIDAGITPYPYPRWICRIIAKKDLATMSFACRNRGVMEAAMPPERWTPGGEDPTEHYDRVWAFLQDHMTDTTIYNVFWSANNYAMPDPIPELDTEMEYWYGENEKKGPPGQHRLRAESLPRHHAAGVSRSGARGAGDDVPGQVPSGDSSVRKRMIRSCRNSKMEKDCQ